MRGPLAVVLSFSLLGSACATSSPVLVEPRTVAPGDFAVTLGAAGLAPIAGDTRALADSRDAIATSKGTANDGAPGAVVALAARPGIAPVVRAGVAIREGLEGSIRYGGRDVGAGVRWVFAEHRTTNAGARTLSIGVEGRALLRDRPDDGVFPGLVVDSLHGYGGTIPFIAAFQSDAGLVLGYLAAMVGFDRVGARIAYPSINDPNFRDLSVSRAFFGATAGLGIGFRHVHVIAELGVERDLLAAKVDTKSVDVGLWSLTPGFALSLRF